MNKRKILFILIIALLIIIITSLFVGVKTIKLNSVFNPGGSENYIFWQIRVPRVCVSFLAGAGLAICGMACQAIFRNILATPYTLGIASGASFGASCSVHFCLNFSFLGISSISLFAFLGSLISITFVYGISALKSKRLAPETLILAGVALNFFFSSLILFIQYLTTFGHSIRIMRWLMGAISAVGYEPVKQLLPFVVCGSSVIFFLVNELNLLVVSDDISISRGVNLRRIRTVLLFTISLMVGGIVAICGPIGFIGMMAPHICRLIIGADHRFLTPVTFIFGGIFLIICDLVARIIIAPAEIPVGIVTALLGGPFFIWLMLNKDQARWVLK